MIHTISATGDEHRKEREDRTERYLQLTFYERKEEDKDAFKTKITKIGKEREKKG